MSQWSKVENNEFVLQQMQTFYQAHFPIGIRYYLCEWLEEQQWDQIDETLPDHQSQAYRLIQTMLELLQKKITELNGPELFLTRIQLEQSVQNIENAAKINPWELINIIKECLRTEQTLIEQAELAKQQEQQDSIGREQNDIASQMQSVMQTLMQKTKETDSLCKEAHTKQEKFIISFSEGQNIDIQLKTLQTKAASELKTKKEKEFQAEKKNVIQQQSQLATELLQLRIVLGRKFEETVTSLDELQKKILEDELIAWRQRQQLSGNGLVVNSSSLETLQQWCESLAYLIWQNRQQIKKLSQLQQQLPIKFPEGEENRLPKVNEFVTGLLSTLVTSTFIVEQQPPQVLKKGGRFGAVVRLLAGGKLNLQMNPPTVEAHIISASQAEALLRNNDIQGKSESGDILNNSGTMEYQQATGRLSINLRNMTLKKIKRNGKKGIEAVTEEKFCILFQSEFRMGGDELAFQVWTFSLPVVVTVHGTQECNAMATILWDNAFAEIGRCPFVVPDRVEWSQLAFQLNMKFQASTGKGLSETNQAYIASKLFGNKDPSTCHVTWSQFNKEMLPGKQFTFWEWFYSIEKLTKEHLKDLWMDDAIIGFVSKDQAKAWLMSGPPGTFLLRFSDSKSGGISVAWLEGTEVRHLAPCGAKEFHFRGLADRIKDMEAVTRLYPNKDKYEVFSKYYTHTTDTPFVNEDGYVEPEMKSTIPKLNPNDREEMLGMPFSPDTIYGSPGSAAPSQPDLMLDERGAMTPITPIVDSIADMDINSFTDYMPDDIAEVELAEYLNQDMDLNLGLCNASSSASGASSIY